MEPIWESHGRQINEAGLRRGSGKWHLDLSVFSKVFICKAAYENAVSWDVTEILARKIQKT